MNTSTRPLIAGNWKMNGLGSSLAELRRFLALADEAGATGADVVICPPATLLHRAALELAESGIRVGGQDCHVEASGAHTGDVSAEMLLDCGASFVIVGHSERRADHGETDAVVRAKAEAALRAGLIPIVCVGETGEERGAGRALAVVSAQLAGSLPDGLGETEIVVAYEPVWAIGTGNTATIDDIAQMHAHIRGLLSERFGAAGAGARILYGGSVKPANAAEILRTDNVDGALVGGASLNADDFFSIVVAA